MFFRKPSFPQERGRGIASVGDLLHPMEEQVTIALSINPEEALLMDVAWYISLLSFVGENPRLVLGVTLIPKNNPCNLCETGEMV